MRRADAIRRVCAMMHNLSSSDNGQRIRLSSISSIPSMKRKRHALHQRRVRAGLHPSRGRDNVDIRFSHRFVEGDPANPDTQSSA